VYTESHPRRPLAPFLGLAPAPCHPRLNSASFHSPYTLPSSVSRNSFVCHSYENCRVCTNNSHSGTAPASSTFRSKLYRGCRAEIPTQSGRSHLKTFPRVPDLSPVFSHSCALFCTFLHPRRIQPYYFQAIPHSPQKSPGLGGTASTARSALGEQGGTLIDSLLRRTCLAASDKVKQAFATEDSWGRPCLTRS